MKVDKYIGGIPMRRFHRTSGHVPDNIGPTKCQACVRASSTSRTYPSSPLDVLAARPAALSARTSPRPLPCTHTPPIDRLFLPQQDAPRTTCAFLKCGCGGGVG